jgi:hypothetical protein
MPSTINTNRARIVADAVVSAYIHEIAVPQERPAKPAPIEVSKPWDCMQARTRRRSTSLLRVRRWAPPVQRRPAFGSGV